VRPSVGIDDEYDNASMCEPLIVSVSDRVGVGGPAPKSELSVEEYSELDMEEGVNEGL
jgi:hypothetical protein